MRCNGGGSRTLPLRVGDDLQLPLVVGDALAMDDLLARGAALGRMYHGQFMAIGWRWRRAHAEDSTVQGEREGLGEADNGG